jgi:hypothetical protein
MSGQMRWIGGNSVFFSSLPGYQQKLDELWKHRESTMTISSNSKPEWGDVDSN